jgi:hypothetical protein
MEKPMKHLTRWIVVALLAAGLGGCVKVSAPREINIGGQDARSRSKDDWKEYGESFYTSDSGSSSGRSNCED